jgi:thioredoxin reductase
MVMAADCAIIGGGQAGLNAALVLGRARPTALLVDDNNPRNAVTLHSHGFITRDVVGTVPPFAMPSST